MSGARKAAVWEQLRARIVALATKEPELTNRTIAQRVGVRAHSVAKVLAEAGVSRRRR